MPFSLIKMRHVFKMPPGSEWTTFWWTSVNHTYTSFIHPQHQWIFNSKRSAWLINWLVDSFLSSFIVLRFLKRQLTHPKGKSVHSCSNISHKASTTLNLSIVSERYDSYHIASHPVVDFIFLAVERILTNAFGLFINLN